MDLSWMTIVAQLVFLEGILSIDNAAALGALVMHLQMVPIEWPAWVPMSIQKFVDNKGGHQKDAALKIGMLFAYLGRALMLVLAAFIIQIWWVKMIGVAYLIYLAIEHFGEKRRHHTHQMEAVEEAGLDMPATVKIQKSFWQVVGTAIMMDMAFSVDNVIAAVALSSHLWVILLGVALGMIMMRFAAQLFSRMIAWEPALASGAFLLLLAIGLELGTAEIFHFHLEKWMQAAISVVILLLTVAFARIPILKKGLIVFTPFMMACGFVGIFIEFVKIQIGGVFKHVFSLVGSNGRLTS